eukprot:Amastigsp_a1490_34.p4 type:complete len:105 gc:universal Amastigsp_a1490_34:234-548(+)
MESLWISERVQEARESCHCDFADPLADASESARESEPIVRRSDDAGWSHVGMAVAVRDGAHVGDGVAGRPNEPRKVIVQQNGAARRRKDQIERAHVAVDNALGV